jgi:hypothetical protein
VGCGCGSETVLSSTNGNASSGPITAPHTAGPGALAASTADTSAAPTSFGFTVR